METERDKVDDTETDVLDDTVAVGDTLLVIDSVRVSVADCDLVAEASDDSDDVPPVLDTDTDDDGDRLCVWDADSVSDCVVVIVSVELIERD